MSESIQVPEAFQYLRPHQVAELSQEATTLDQRIADRAPGGADKGDMRKRRRAIQKMLDTQQPPDLSPAERDAYAKEARRLEGEFTPGMPSGEEMRKNPPGAVDKNLRWHRRFRHAVFRWKNVIRTLEKGDESPNLANIERFRRWQTPQDLSMQGAQITGTAYVGTHPSPEYQEGWERTFGRGEAEAKASDLPALAKASKRARPKPAPVAMRCGVMKDPRGRRWHEAKCPDCLAMTPEATG
jgi:hypothetical protein